ncbi:ABC transporter ATP-binding protein [Brevibacillus humidisoli]|uniref:ABC transporter ATP-binding protein n=1 Tax=Brevibacillus humidisoli TaxID=2895522 RepID=UPI001E45FB71|nr:ABC transporter ATP-binding protein [Brevibacillus humidisoli]UFJ41373.1 ABC transporter ATP-binding protein [Brevibacillus humidisoli]
MDAIQVNDLAFSYDRKTNAVDHLSFSVTEGEIFGFLGPSGAGKSTTIKLLTRLLVPPVQSVFLLGQDMAKADHHFFRNIGIAFENDVLYPTLTGFENLYFHAKLYGIGRAEIEQILKTMDIYDAKDKRVSDYSKGMKTRLVLARAIVTKPRILFLDEPTSGMDPEIAAYVREVLLSLNQEGTTMFLTTHDMHEAETLCDRIAFFHNGRIVDIDSPEHYRKKYGQQQVIVELAGEQLCLDRYRDWDRLNKIWTEQKWSSIRSKEATLEEIFIKVVGRGLRGGESE